MSHDPENSDSNDRWLVSYADFITLMFAFFAVLYATSEKDMEKSKEFQESIKKYLIKAGAFGDSGQQIQQGVKGNTVIEPPIETFLTNKPEAAKILDQVERFVDERFTQAERQRFILGLEADDWGVRITVNAAALYSPEGDMFRESAVPFLNKLAEVSAASGRKVLIEGHVARGEKGNFKSTWDFAAQRAISLLRYIQKRQKIPEHRLIMASFADSRLLYTGEKSAQNSRIELVILNADMEL